MPFSSVAMTEKFALLRIACCKAPDFTISSSTRTLARRALPASCTAVSDGSFLKGMDSSMMGSGIAAPDNLTAAVAVAVPVGPLLQNLDGEQGVRFHQC